MNLLHIQLSKLPSEINYYTLLLFTCIFTSVQGDLYDPCEVEYAKAGKCLYLKDCPAAVKLIQGGKLPKHCGFNKLEPIICCEQVETKSPQNYPVGYISDLKCNQTYAHLHPNIRRRDHRTYENLQGETLVHGWGIGRKSLAKEYVHMAALGYGEPTEIAWLCGGSLISTTFVLTAGHCITYASAGGVKYVRLGDLNLKRDDDDAQPQNFNVAETIIHPDYKPPQVYNDIALIKLDKEAQITRYVRPACLHTDPKFSYPSWRATGWGVTSFQGEQADHLQVMNLDEFDLDICQSAYTNSSKRRMNRGIDFKTQMCAGHPTMDTCQGDSGGPLQTVNRRFIDGYTIIGITSFGKPCGLTRSPGVYTRVLPYVEWIEAHIWSES